MRFYALKKDFILISVIIWWKRWNYSPWVKNRCKNECISKEQITEAFQAGRSCSVYLGHYCNWEWISSLPMHLGNAGISAQIYHPLENKAFDRLFLYMRGRFGATSIQMDDTFRTILGWKKKGQTSIIGQISLIMTHRCLPVLSESPE